VGLLVLQCVSVDVVMLSFCCHLFDSLILIVVTDDVVVAVSNSGLVKVWTIHDASDTRLVRK